MRALLHSLAVLAVLLSGISAGDLRALTGMNGAPSDTIAAQFPDLSHDKATCCDDTIGKSAVPDKETSECHSTPAFLAESGGAVPVGVTSVCFFMQADRANGTSTTPTGPPPKVGA